jgi:single-stranded DNA-binding protein
VDTNLVVLTGTVVSAAERAVGHQGRTLTELRLAVARPGRKGEAEAPPISVTIWDYALGTAVRELADGTPLTVVGRLQGRVWNERLYLEVIGERVTVDVAAGPGEPAAPAERPVPQAPPREPADADARPDPPGRDRVPF